MFSISPFFMPPFVARGFSRGNRFQLLSIFLAIFAIVNFRGAVIFAADSVGIWVNNGQDKVTRQSLRMTRGGIDVRTTGWDGRTVKLVAAKNETVAFNVVIESPSGTLRDVQARFDRLKSPAGEIASKARLPDESLWDFRERPIELFLVRYLRIRGVSTLSYEHFDERHVPERMRRPHDGRGYARGVWEDRPDHDQDYPDILAPLELHPKFDVEAGTNQSIWADVYVPRHTAAGIYRGRLTLRASNLAEVQVPVELRVLNWSLPDLPTAKTMLYVSQEDIYRRYLGKRYLEAASGPEIIRGRKVLDRHFQLAHRHRVSLIHEHTPIGQMDQQWRPKLDGSLFTPKYGYAGPGVGVGNNVLSIGTYGAWPWKDGDRGAMWRATNRWAQYFKDAKFETPTEYFLYLIDESDDFEKIETWSQWVLANPGIGKSVPTLATLSLPKAKANTPSLTLPCATAAYGITDDWEEAAEHYRETPGKSFYLYNGGRIGSGSLATEDDGIALRMLAWCHFKFKAARWFIWQGTYYENFQGGTGETKLFSQAHTFGSRTGRDKSKGETGGNYNNGDGVMFYPGTDRVYPEESYQVDGPLASVRLKLWRRGLQDYEYLAAAEKIDPRGTRALVQKCIPKVLWEVGVTDPDDPSYVRGDISWSTDPDDWERARAELIGIIESNQP
ncbi:MAG: DUF4091 domain-containing protein [Planctomycetota bacterium]